MQLGRKSRAVKRGCSVIRVLAIDMGLVTSSDAPRLWRTADECIIGPLFLCQHLLGWRDISTERVTSSDAPRLWRRC
jgi:hypothetical protein